MDENKKIEKKGEWGREERKEEDEKENFPLSDPFGFDEQIAASAAISSFEIVSK